MNYRKNIGKFVKKESGKPFKSGLRVALVKGIVDHPILHIPAYTFIEDDGKSYVECRQCIVVSDIEELRKIIEEDIERYNDATDTAIATTEKRIEVLQKEIKQHKLEKWSAEVSLKYWFTEEEGEVWAQELLTEIEKRKRYWSLIPWKEMLSWKK